MEAKIKFTCTMFTTLEYKGCTWKRDAKETISKYLSHAERNGIEIIDCVLIKENKKSGRHDGYAKGNYYQITGAYKTKDRFQIFHGFRHVDYFCVSPVLFNSIKFNP